MLTSIQRERRKKSLGASDMAAVLGLNPYKSAYDVWLEKAGKLQEVELKSKAADAGNRFERAVISWASERLGAVRRNVFVVAGDDIPIHSNLDAQLKSDLVPIESKTAGLFNRLSDDWGEEGTDQIPSQYVVQAQVQMICTDRQICHVPAFLGGRGFAMFRVEANKDLQEIIKARAIKFWRENVMADVAPAESYPDLETISRRIRVPGKVVPVGIDLLKGWDVAKNVRKQAEEAEEQAKVKCMMALGDAEGSEPTEGLALTYFAQASSGSKIDSAKLLAEFPQVYAKVKKPDSKIRVLRIKKIK